MRARQTLCCPARRALYGPRDAPAEHLGAAASQAANHPKRLCRRRCAQRRLHVPSDRGLEAASAEEAARSAVGGRQKIALKRQPAPRTAPSPGLDALQGLILCVWATAGRRRAARREIVFLRGPGARPASEAHLRATRAPSSGASRAPLCARARAPCGDCGRFAPPRGGQVPRSAV